MKMKKSQLKEAVKAVVRECLIERHMKEGCDGGGGHLAGGEKGERMFKHIKKGYKGEKSPEDAEHIAAATVNKNLGQEQVGSDVVDGGGTDNNAVLDKVVKFAIRKLPGYDAETLAKTAGDLFTGITGGQTLDPSVVAAAVQKHMKASDTLENPSECGTMQDEAGLNVEDGEEEIPSLPADAQIDATQGHEYDEKEEIMLIKVMKKCAEKLEAMRQGMPGSEEEPEVEVEPEDEKPETPFEEPGEDNEEPFEKPEDDGGEEKEDEKPDDGGEEKEDENPIKEASFKKIAKHAYTDAAENKALTIQTDPEINEVNDEGQFKVAAPRQARVAKDDHARKIQNHPKVTENHKVQKRSYATSNDGPQDPDNVRDPEVPQA